MGTPMQAEQNFHASGGIPVFCLQSLKHIRLGQLKEHQAGFGDTVLTPLRNGAGGHFAQFGNLGAAAEGVNNFGWCDHSAANLSRLKSKKASPLRCFLFSLLKI